MAYRETGQTAQLGCLGPAISLREETSAIFIRPPAEVGLAFLQGMKTSIKWQKINMRVRKSYSAEAELYQLKESGLQRPTESPWCLGEILAKIFA